MIIKKGIEIHEVVKTLIVGFGGKTVRIEARQLMREGSPYFVAVSEYITHTGSSEPYKPYPSANNPDEALEDLIEILRSRIDPKMGDEQWIPNPLWN